MWGIKIVQESKKNKGNFSGVAKNHKRTKKLDFNKDFVKSSFDFYKRFISILVYEYVLSSYLPC